MEAEEQGRVADRLRTLIGRPEAEPDPRSPAACAARLRQALEMADMGIDMMRQNLRRRFPQDSEEGIARRLSAWLRQRPGAEHGDAWGRPIPERLAEL